MPRDGSGFYAVPPGTDGAPDTTIDSARYNLFTADLEQVLNTPSPIISGGTGGSSPDAALKNIGGEKAGQVVTNFNQTTWLSGSFFAASTATGGPIANHAFSGIAYVTDVNNMFIEARDKDGTTLPAPKYIRQMKAGVWGAWTVETTGGGGATGPPGQPGVGAPPSVLIPQPAGTPGQPGTATPYAREDHVHPRGLVSAFSFTGNNTSIAAPPTDINIANLPSKNPTGADFLLLSDQAASGAWKKALVSSIGGGGGGGGGNVVGPSAGAVDGHVAVFDGATGLLIKDGGPPGTGGGASVTISDTPPASPTAGNLWWESDTGNLYIFYNDGNSSQWVLAVPAVSASALNAVTYTPQTLTTDVGTTMGQCSQSRTNIYAAPFDALAYSGLQINGSMDVSQELGITGTSISGTYICDGWLLGRASAAVVAAAQAQGHFSNFVNDINIVVTTAGPATPAAGDNVYLAHRIEGYRIARLSWGTTNAQPITLCFWTRHVRTGLYSVSIRTAASDRSYIATYTQNVSDTPEYKVVTIPGETTGTWANTNVSAMVIGFALATGATQTAPAANTWYTTNYTAAPGQVNAVQATTDRFRITGLVVLPGLEAPTAARSPLIMRPYDQELLTCQRYWESSYDYGLSPGAVSDNGSVRFYFNGGTAAAYTASLLIRFKVNKRGAPTVTSYSPTTGASGKVRDRGNNTDVNASIVFPGTSGMGIDGSLSASIGQVNLNAHYVADARL